MPRSTIEESRETLGSLELNLQRVTEHIELARASCGEILAQSMPSLNAKELKLDEWFATLPKTLEEEGEILKSIYLRHSEARSLLLAHRQESVRSIQDMETLAPEEQAAIRNHLSVARNLLYPHNEEDVLPAHIEEATKHLAAARKALDNALITDKGKTSFGQTVRNVIETIKHLEERNLIERAKQLLLDCLDDCEDLEPLDDFFENTSANTRALTHQHLGEISAYETQLKNQTLPYLKAAISKEKPEAVSPSLWLNILRAIPAILLLGLLFWAIGYTCYQTPEFLLIIVACAAISKLIHLNTPKT